MTDSRSADLSGLRIDRSAKRPQGGNRARTLALLAALAGILTVVILFGVRRSRATEVRVAPVEAVGGAPGAAAAEVLTANGYVVARRRASVSTEVAGRLEALYVAEGSRVREGQMLGVLRNDEQRAAVRSAQADLSTARAARAEAEASAYEAGLARKRLQALLTKGLVSQSDFDEADARAKVADARVQSAAASMENARARLSAAQVDYARTFIRAPFSGAVLRKEAEVGEIVSPIPSSGGLTRGAIVTMADLSTLEVDVDVNEGYVARTHEGMRAEIALDAYPGDRYPGRVRQIVPTADRQKATVLVKVTFDSLDARVLPEMGAKVTFLADQEPAAAGTHVVTAAVTIPKGAVADRGGRAVVFVVEKGRAALRSVGPRPYGADRVVVSGGLAPGELVVLDPPAALADGSRIKPAGGKDVNWGEHGW
ncbi:MAG TPA: efflux RND transporter periplasmic adaptor subunit [Candidatus Eisenbacteria bacterium]|nr:efflux RND transporter periplasmic adaptor subunit [Candidatus Eisenbacteria bacterium]